MKYFTIALVLGVASAASYVPTPNMCWTETKKCRYEAEHGYTCQDYYPEKYARCYPTITYKKICDDPTIHPSPMPTHPKDLIDKGDGKSKIIKYDPNYGSHVKDYPAKGTSDYYYTDKLPTYPKGVTKYPSPPPKYTAPPTYAPVYTAKPTKAPIYTTPPTKPHPTQPHKPDYSTTSY